MNKLFASEVNRRFNSPNSDCQTSDLTKKKMTLPTRISGILLGILLTANAFAQSPSTAPSTAAPVPLETSYYIKFKIKPGRNADFEKAIGDMLAQARKKEPGNVYIDLFHLHEDLQTYVVFERYKDVAASKAHTESDYIKKLGDALKDNLLDGPPELEALAFIRSK